MQVTEQQRNDALLQIERLVQFAIKNNMIQPEDEAYTRNALLDLFSFDEPFEGKVVAEHLSSPVEILEKLLDYGYAIGLIEENTLTYRDLLDAKIMGLVMPRPSEFIANFNQLASEKGIMAATDYFYKLSVDSTYIRMDRIQKNPSWLHTTSYGNLQITENC